MKIPIVISGALGRMGRAVALAAREDPAVTIAGALENPKHPDLGVDLAAALRAPLPRPVRVGADPRPLLRRKAVWIEFSDPGATLAHLRLAAPRAYPMVIGTTGFSASERAEILRLSRKTALILSANMSFGVNTLFHLVSEAARILGPAYQTEILELHHNQKKDAPSGTALSLADILAAARGEKTPELLVYDRSRKREKRTDREIGMASLRLADVVGEHTVFFATPGERLELTHRATNRDTFARGALRAAKLLFRKRPGSYRLPELLVRA